MAETIVKLVFRYRGTFDFERMFKQGQEFFKARKFELVEKKYKDKSNEFEGVWVAVNKIDLYNKIAYEVEFKAIDMSPVTNDGKKLWNGKIYVYITGTLDQNYDEPSIAGKKTIFNDKGGKPSWLHKIYKKITLRDKEEYLEDEVTTTAHKFVALLKSICGSETMY